LTHFNDEFFNLISIQFPVWSQIISFVWIFTSEFFRDLFIDSSALLLLYRSALNTIFIENGLLTSCTSEWVCIFRMVCRTCRSATLRRTTSHLLISSVAMLRGNAFFRRTELQLATLGVFRAKYTRAYSSYYINF